MNHDGFFQSKRIAVHFPIAGRRDVGSVHANEKVSDEEVDGEDERRQSGGHLEAAVGDGVTADNGTDYEAGRRNTVVVTELRRSFFLRSHVSETTLSKR